MIPSNVKSFFLVVTVALISSRYVSCVPNPGTFRIIKRWDTNLQVNSSNRNSAGVGHFPIDENELLDTERIVGGKYAAPNQFPFMAVVHRLMGNGMISQCGGTIISPRWVLTAGHCVAPQPRQFLVVFGVNDKTGIGYNFYQGPGIAMMTNQAVLHPAYQTSMNDIALLYMPQNIPFGESIQPIQLAGYSDITETFANRISLVIGWGKDGPFGTGTKRLKYATLPIISNYRCSAYWSITRSHVCTAPGYGQDACQGDSGGPLIVLENGVPLQVGIVSYGDGNCPSGRPGVFTRVSGFIDWIQDVTSIHF